MNKEGSRKIIVAVAPVGRQVAPPSINPLTPAEVAKEVIDCTRAGASMVHLHVRDSHGEQTEDIRDFSRTLDIIRESSDIIIQGVHRRDVDPHAGGKMRQRHRPPG